MSLRACSAGSVGLAPAGSRTRASAHLVLRGAVLQAVLRRDDGEVDAAVLVAVPERCIGRWRTAPVVVVLCDGGTAAHGMRGELIM